MVEVLYDVIVVDAVSSAKPKHKATEVKSSLGVSILRGLTVVQVFEHLLFQVFVDATDVPQNSRRVLEEMGTLSITRDTLDCFVYVHRQVQNE